MKNNWIKYLLFSTLVLFWGCKDEAVDEILAPTEADAAFTFEASADNDNIIEFTASVSGFAYSWDFGNGTSGSESTGTATYPSAGTYTVTLTVRNQGGSASSSQDVVIAATDPTLLDIPLYNLLTGGVEGGGMKTWAVDSASAAHFGVGPSASNGDYSGNDFPTYYAAGINEKVGAGFYDDRYTFNLEEFGFDMETQGEIYLNVEQEANFPGAYDPGVGDRTAPFTPSEGLTWNLSFPAEGEEGDTTLTISADGFIGYYTGVQTYKVISITENELFLQFADAANDALFWYVRLVPAGFDSNPDGPAEVVKANLPLGFETQTPDFTSFEGNAAAIIDNPDASGINTSAKVLELVKGNLGYSGTFFDLNTPIDVVAGTTATLKVWAPATGVFRFKIENGSGANVEVDATVDAAEEWVEVSFDLSALDGNTVDRIVLFPSWDVPNGGTFYVDDINVQ